MRKRVYTDKITRKKKEDRKTDDNMEKRIVQKNT